MQRLYTFTEKNLTRHVRRHVVTVGISRVEKHGPMTRDSETCEEQQPAVVLAGMASKKKAVTFDDWLRSDDGRYAVLQDVLVASDDECEWTTPRFVFFSFVPFALVRSFVFVFPVGALSGFSFNCGVNIFLNP